MTKSSYSAPDVEDLTLSEGDRRELIAWAELCLRRLLPIFTRHRQDDSRLDRALDAISDFRTGDLAVRTMRKRASSCHDAARDCEDPASSAVARACGQAIAISHMGGHARNIARYTRKALSGQELTDELGWQRSELPTRFESYVYSE